MVRQSHQAKKPEKLNPKIRATPLRRPMEASSPIVLNEKGLSGRRLSDAVILCATTLPSRIACCAVGGCDFPGCLASGTNPQSPTAHTPGQPGTSKNWFTKTRPHSFLQGSEETSGLGTVPAVHTKVLAGMGLPLVRKI